MIDSAPIGFRSFLAYLEESGQIDPVAREVDPQFELPGVTELIERRGRAYRFDKVRGARYPLVGGFFNDFARLGVALGRKADVPFGLNDLSDALESAKNAPVAPVEVESGPIKDARIVADEVDLGHLPVPTVFELDSGPFITGAVGVTRDPESGELNVGVYRTLVTGNNRMVVNASSMSDLRRIYARWEERGEKMPIALAIGVSPSLFLAAAAKPAPGQGEYDVAGGFLQSAVELVRCEDSDLMVPADAEFVLEGTVDFSERVENLLGEFAGQYGPETAPVTTVNTITHRRDPIYYSILAGRNPEHNNIGGIAAFGIKDSIADALHAAIPDIKRVNAIIDPAVGTLAHVVIAIDKESDEQPRRIIEQAYTTSSRMFPISMIAKRIVIVDDDIDIESLADVEWAIWSRVAREDKIILFPDMPTAEFERAAKSGMKSLRVGIDATMDLDDVDKLVRPVIPGADGLRLKDYL